MGRVSLRVFGDTEFREGVIELGALEHFGWCSAKIHFRARTPHCDRFAINVSSKSLTLLVGPIRGGDPGNGCWRPFRYEKGAARRR